MTRYVVEARSRFIVDGAQSADQALAWFDDPEDEIADVSADSYGHLQVAGELADDDVAPSQLEPGAYQAWKTLHVEPLAGRWAPEAWPARACAGNATRGLPRITSDPREASDEARPAQQPYVIDSGRGGFHPIQRLLGLLVDIRCEAHAAKQVLSKRERDMAFDEIAQLADQAMQLVERHAKPGRSSTQLREVTRVS
jgi:hypothetical protein